ncbi:TfoX/Sxy family protein [Streptomyces sp. UNOB3_S3]|uniref:TfoX/Sxy family protein n=1 Tax=Streptomyces sp. UNOB3_S3 TaxID=2871682 RepID=UPI001E349B9E|nr:TfoX/Sxy family protein [Streptomyces sp. UNOB3_S3]MCC3778826.1 TfoX/Sxy family protein [Streptomyces sp. UNOB3_S3]
MAYDEVLAGRLKERLEPEGVTAKKMFAGLTFLLQGNALANLYDEGLMVRVGKEGMDEALARPGAQPLVIRGKEQRGWVLLDESTLDDEVLDEWLTWAVEVTAELPPK